jgi:neutral ceramidase
MTLRPVLSFSSLLRPARIAALLVLAAVAHLAGAENAPVFRAGADRADITPDLGTPIPGGFKPPAATHIHDPLHVRTLVLDDGSTRLAIVVCDNAALPLAVCDEAKRRVLAQTGLPVSRVLMSATHTHSAGSAFRMPAGDMTHMLDRDGGMPPSSEPLSPYQAFIAKRVADSVQNAINRLEPARIGWGSGQVPDQVFNRRWFVKSEKNRRNPFGGVDQVRMNPGMANPDLLKPAGPTDPEVSFLAVQARDGRPLALLANYSLHYVGRGGPTDFSADYFGMFSERIGELLGATRQVTPFVGMMSNGTSADVTNNNYSQPPPKAEPPYVKMRRVANIVAAEVYRAYQSVAFQDWVKLDARYEELPLQPRRPTPEMLTYARELLARPAGGLPWHAQERLLAHWNIQSLTAPDRLRVPIQAFRIGDLGIGSAPVEIFAEMGLELKARTPFGRTFTISLANGWFGYMPTPAQHELGGYETWSGINRLEKEAAPKIVTALLGMFASMRQEAPAR